MTNLKTLLYLILISSSLLLTFSAIANVRPARIFSSNMVLQQGQENALWGWADKGERITISFAGKTIKVKANSKGKWQTKLPALEYGGPYELKIQGKNTITLKNILIGEVWVCSGQSNMEWPLSQSDNPEEEIANAKYPQIRLFTVTRRTAQDPMQDLEEGEWVVCTPETIANFSAVGYFFGRELHQTLNVPIGLVHTSWGGTVAETWMSRESIETDVDFKEKLDVLQALDIEEHRKKLEPLAKSFTTTDVGLLDGIAHYAQTDLDDSGWKSIAPSAVWEENGYASVDGIGWYRKTVELSEADLGKEAALYLGPIDDNDITWVNGVRVGETNNYEEHRLYPIPNSVLQKGANTIAVRVEDTGGGGGMYGSGNDKYIKIGDKQINLGTPWKFKFTKARIGSYGIEPNDFPTVLFNGMIHPLIPYGIKGAIWYQGESNTARAKQYQRIFPNLITDWRTHWNQGNFPFLFVSLANFMAPDETPVESDWAELREAQAKTLKLPNTGMAITIDIGEEKDIHPRNKQDVGKRLALASLKKAYGKNVIHSGPMFKSVTYKGSKAYVTFKETGSGLMTKNKYGYINSFAMAGADGNFVWAKASIVNKSTVEVFAEAIKEPSAVRLGWSNNPDDFNLYNIEGLPAIPFRTDLE